MGSASKIRYLSGFAFGYLSGTNIYSRTAITKHTIGKKETVCVIDEERFQSKQRNRTRSLENDGLFIEGMTLFIEKSFFKYTPHSGEKILVDGVRYLVEETKEDMGLLEIDLTRYDEK